MSEEDPTEEAGQQGEGKSSFTDTYSQAPEIYKEAWDARAKELGIPVTELPQQEIHNVYGRVGAGFEIAEKPPEANPDAPVPPVESPLARAGLLRGDLPKEPTTVAYKPSSVEQPPPNEDRRAAPLGPEPAPFRMEATTWEEPSEAVKKHSEEPPMFPPGEFYPEVKYFNADGQLEEGWQRVRVSDTGDIIIRRLNPGGGSETKFVPVERYEEMQAREVLPVVGEEPKAETTTTAPPATPEVPVARLETPLEKALAQAQEAAAGGNTEEYIRLTAELIAQLSAEAKKGGIGVEAQVKLQEKAFGERMSTKERAEQAVRDMCNIHNIEELRDTVGRNRAERKQAIDKHLRLGTPLEAPADVQAFVNSLVSMPQSRFNLIKDQLKEPEEIVEEDENVSGKLDPSAEYRVEISNGLGEMAGGYKITAVYIENGKTFVDLEKPGTDKDNPAKDALIRTHLPASTVLKWQEPLKEKKVGTTADEVLTTKIESMVNPDDAKEMAQSAQRVEESLEAARRRRAEEAEARENDKKVKRAFSFVWERAKNIRGSEIRKPEKARRLLAALAIALSLDRAPETALAAAGLTIDKANH